MRMRKKNNLEERMILCSRLLAGEPARYFGRWLESSSGKKELWLELGCGKGRFTVETALQNPEALLVAVEKLPDVMVIAAELACAAGIENIRFIDGDVLALPFIFAESEVDRIFINFCDPWPKPRDAGKRLTSPDFLGVYESILKPEGEMHFKTDNNPLFEYSQKALLSRGWTLSEVTRDLHGEGQTGVLTDYELKFCEQGLKINRLVAGKENHG